MFDLTISSSSEWWFSIRRELVDSTRTEMRKIRQLIQFTLISSVTRCYLVPRWCMFSHKFNIVVITESFLVIFESVAFQSPESHFAVDGFSEQIRSTEMIAMILKQANLGQRKQMIIKKYYCRHIPADDFLR